MGKNEWTFFLAYNLSGTKLATEITCLFLLDFLRCQEKRVSYSVKVVFDHSDIYDVSLQSNSFMSSKNDLYWSRNQMCALYLYHGNHWVVPHWETGCHCRVHSAHSGMRVRQTGICCCCCYGCCLQWCLRVSVCRCCGSWGCAGTVEEVHGARQGHPEAVEWEKCTKWHFSTFTQPMALQWKRPVL